MEITMANTNSLRVVLCRHMLKIYVKDSTAAFGVAQPRAGKSRWTSFVAPLCVLGKHHQYFGCVRLVLHRLWGSAGRLLG